MGKGSRANLDRLLRSAWEVQRRLVLQQTIVNSEAAIQTTPIVRIPMLRETKFGYGFLLVGAGLPFLIDKLFGIRWAIVISVACFIVGVVFLVEGHRHKEGAIQKPWTLWEYLATGGAVVALIAVISIAALRKMSSSPSNSEAPKATTMPTSLPIPTKLPDLKWRYDLEIYGDVKDPAGQKIFPNGHNIIIAGEISNVGEVASIARDWNLTVRMVGEETERQTNLIGPFPSKGEFVNGLGGVPHNVEMSFENYLPESTTTEPLIPGSNKPGFLIFGIKGVALNRLEAGGNTFTMGFGDVTGKVYKFDLVTPRAGQLPPHFAIPGMRFPPG